MGAYMRISRRATAHIQLLLPKAIDTLADDNSVQVGSLDPATWAGSPCGRKGVCRVQELTLEGIEGWITVAARRASLCGKRGGGELE